MGKGDGLKPLGAPAISVDASDEQLVARAQGGSSEAFAVLFRRYRPAIARYVARTLRDDARAEDVVQEVFLSALRSIGTLDRPAGFKPWLYRIAHNTCVDQVRRSSRSQEVSIDPNGLPANEEIRLFRQGPSSYKALTQKEDFKNLSEAFGGLPRSQSDVLLMRELEGLSYEEIAARMGISRASVESMLFRARQGLRDEYGQIATGERCTRMHIVMARMAEGIGGLRDRRTLARHVRGCQHCRRDAYAMGLGGLALEAPTTGVRGKLSRVAALLPLPWLIHRRADETGAASSSAGGGSSIATQAQTALTQLSSSVGLGADQAATAVHKAVAVVAAVAVVGGGGLVATRNQSEPDLLLKPDRNTTRQRAGIGPAVPPALLPVAHHRAGAPGAAPLAGTPGGTLGTGGPIATAPAELPAGIPGPTELPGVPDAMAAPSDPGAQGGTGQGGDTPSAGGPDTILGTDTTLPAAGSPDSSSGGNGSSDGGPSGDGSSGGSGSGSGGSGSGGSGGGSHDPGTTDPPSGGGTTAPGGSQPPECDLPPGLEKKDKLPPGHAKKCAAALEAAAQAAP
jgi:RNA polymerase sigma factor (sigma-70 family)